MTKPRRPRSPRPEAFLSLLAGIAVVTYLLGWASGERIALAFGFLAVMALDSIAGSLDRASRPQQSVTPWSDQAVQQDDSGLGVPCHLPGCTERHAPGDRVTHQALRSLR